VAGCECQREGDGLADPHDVALGCCTLEVGRDELGAHCVDVVGAQLALTRWGYVPGAAREPGGLREQPRRGLGLTERARGSGQPVQCPACCPQVADLAGQAQRLRVARGGGPQVPSSRLIAARKFSASALPARSPIASLSRSASSQRTVPRTGLPQRAAMSPAQRSAEASTDR